MELIFVRTQCIYSCMTYLCKHPVGLGFVQNSWSSLSLPVQTCIMLWVCSYWETSVCVCGNHLLVHAITHHPFKIGSPNMDHRCKRPWLRSLLLCGGDWPWPSRSNLTLRSKVTPFWACRHDNSSPVQARITKFGPKVQNAWVKIPNNFGIDWLWSSI